VRSLETDYYESLTLNSSTNGDPGGTVPFALLELLTLDGLFSY